ncbi:MAG TPA: hypothetical protein DEQ26_05225 [Flavobacteriaceae bacterium]|nr:hypothetical protein [Flavobacteriaceae bacterium]
MSKNIGKIIRVNSLPPKGERLTNVIYQVAVSGTATYIDYAVDENGDIKTPTLDKSLADNDFSKVKTVNNEAPDEQGNIDLNDYVQIYNSEEELQEIWDNGIRDKIYFNHQTKDMVIGNSDGDGYSLFKMDKYLDKPITIGTDQEHPYVVVVDNEGNSAKRNLDDFGKVKTVNGEDPDEQGNIKLDLDYIPLTGTKKNNPLTGTIVTKGEKPVVNNEGFIATNAEPFKTSEVKSSEVITEEFNIDNGKIVNLKYDTASTKYTFSKDFFETTFLAPNISAIRFRVKKEGIDFVNRSSYSPNQLDFESTIEQFNYNSYKGGSSPISKRILLADYAFNISVTKGTYNVYNFTLGSDGLTIGAGSTDWLRAKSDAFYSTVKYWESPYFNNFSFTQKGYVDLAIDAIYAKPTNWTHPQQRMSGLVSKHNDATYNRLMGMDTNGNLNEVGLPAMTNEMSKSTDAQKDAFRLASRKTNEKFNSNAPVLLVVNPFLLKNSNDFPTSIIITGNNLFIDKESSKVEIRKIKTIDEVPEIGNWIDLTASVSVSELNQNILSIYHNFKLFELGYYEIKVTNHLGLANLTSPLLLIVDNYEETITNPLIIENSHGNIQNTLQVNPKGFELIGNPTVNGGVLFNDLVNIVDSNVNSITKLSLVLNVPSSDYNIGTLSVGFTDVNEISTTTTTKMGVLLYYYNWGVEIRDMNNGNLKRIQYENGKILYNMNFYLFIKDGTYSILSENTAAVSEGFYTDLQKLKLMFNIISPAQGRAENYKLSLDIASFKKL